MKFENFDDWVAICELKARYCRFLDTKQWNSWTELFTEDVVLDTSKAVGPPPITGRDTAVFMVRGTLDTARTAHHVHMPEITIAGDSAEIIWAMQHRVSFENGYSFVGYGHYTETYVKRADGWKIARSKLTRLNIDMVPPGAGI